MAAPERFAEKSDLTLQRGHRPPFRCGAAIARYEGHSCRAGRMLASVKRGGSLCSATPSMLGEIDKIGLVSPIAKQAFVGGFCPHTGCNPDNLPAFVAGNTHRVWGPSRRARHRGP